MKVSVQSKITKSHTRSKSSARVESNVKDKDKSIAPNKGNTENKGNAQNKGRDSNKSSHLNKGEVRSKVLAPKQESRKQDPQNSQSSQKTSGRSSQPVVSSAPTPIRASTSPSTTISRGEQTFKPMISRDDLISVLRCLLSDRLTETEGGTLTRTFEEAFAKVIGQKDALFVNNDSAAFSLLLMSFRLTGEDEVVISPFTEPALWEAIRTTPAKAVFVDCAPGRFSWDLETLLAKISSRTRVLVLPHAFGFPHDHAATLVPGLRKKFPDLIIIEDALHALGTTYSVSGRKHAHVGRLGDYTVFSLSPIRALTSAKGAVIVSLQDGSLDELRLYRAPGIPGEMNSGRGGSSASKGNTRGGSLIKPSSSISRDKNKSLGGPRHDFRRLDFAPTEMEAALGLSQLQSIKPFALRRQAIREAMEASLSKKATCQVLTTLPAGNGVSNDRFLPLYFPRGKNNAYTRMSRAGLTGLQLEEHTLYGALGTSGLLETYDMTGYPNVEDLHRRLLLIPIYASMKESLLERTQTLLASL